MIYLMLSLAFADTDTNANTNTETSDGQVEPEVKEANQDSSNAVDSQNSTPNSPNTGVITLHNGNVIQGEYVQHPNGDITLILTDDSRLQINKDMIKEIQELDSHENGVQNQHTSDSTFFKDRSHTRYLYFPTAIPMEVGTGYFSQKELIVSAVAYSPVQNWSFLVATSIPTILYGLVYGGAEDEITAGVGVRYGKKVSDNVYLGGGVEHFHIFGDNLTLPFVNGTLGDENRNITLGTTISIDNFNEPTSTPVTLSGYYRFSESMALVSENWFLFAPQINKETVDGTTTRNVNLLSPEYTGLYASTGVRFISPKFSTDLSIVHIILHEDDGSFPFYIPLPWLDVTRYF